MPLVIPYYLQKCTHSVKGYKLHVDGNVAVKMILYDRIIKYTTNDRPTFSDLERIVTGYVGDIGAHIEWNEGRLMVILPGTSPVISRTMEIILVNRVSHILTKGANDFTTAIALHLHQMMKGFWVGDGEVWTGDEKTIDPNSRGPWSPLNEEELSM